MTDHDDYYYNGASDFLKSEEGIEKYFIVLFSLLAVVLVLSKYLHTHPRIQSILPEAGMIIIIGTIAGATIFAFKPLLQSENYYEENEYYGYAADDHDDHDDHDDRSNQGSSSSVNRFVVHGLLSFSPTVFFFILLPPILFNSGYHLRRDVFFRHIASISLFACVGTVISTLVIATSLQVVKCLGWTGDFRPHFIELLTFGSMVSATDPVSTLAVFQLKKVDPQLFYLVFGESVLNNAVGLVLFKIFSKVVGNQKNYFETTFAAFVEFLLDFSFGFVGSILFGFCTGLCSSIFLKTVDMRHTPLLELSLFFLIVYMPFYYAELLGLSGIVTILFTGIFARRYTTGNLSDSTEEHVDILFRLAAQIAETSIFLELGLSVFGLSDTIMWKFAGWAILACLIGRMLNIYPLAAIYNTFLLKNAHAPMETAASSIDCESSIMSNTPTVKKDLKIRNNTAHMLWMSGLRGAAAYACAKTFPNAYGNRSHFVSTTMAIILFTIFTFGLGTELALNLLDIQTGCDEEQYMKKNNTVDKMNYINMFGKFKSRHLKMIL